MDCVCNREDSPLKICNFCVLFYIFVLKDFSICQVLTDFEGFVMFRRWRKQFSTFNTNRPFLLLMLLGITLYVEFILKHFKYFPKVSVNVKRYCQNFIFRFIALLIFFKCTNFTIVNQAIFMLFWQKLKGIQI